MHIGDSHVQADVFTGELRNLLQQSFGYGGRGLVFPYSTGHTHAAIDYATTHTGRWLYAKNVEQSPELPMGATGVSSKTYDSAASFTIKFKTAQRPEFTRLRIFLSKTEESYDLVLKTNHETINIDVYDK